MDTVTTASLLEGLKDRDNTRAWSRFFNRYQPMVFAFARRMGLDDHTAQETSQDALATFVQAYWEGRYDPAKGRLRSWLFKIAYCKVIDMRRRKNEEIVFTDRSDATAFLNRIESPDEAEAVWEREWQQHILNACVEKARQELDPATTAAFELYVLQGRPVQEVAEQLGITPNAVYIAKNRTLTRIRKIRAEMEAI